VACTPTAIRWPAKLIFEVEKLRPDTYVAEVGNKIGAELLKPHLCYAPALKISWQRDGFPLLATSPWRHPWQSSPCSSQWLEKRKSTLPPGPFPAIFKYLAKLGKIDTTTAAILQTWVSA